MQFLRIFPPLWLALSSIVPLFAVLLGMHVLRRSSGDGGVVGQGDRMASAPEVDVLVPVRGTRPDQERLLSALVEQDLPGTRVVFIVEDRADPVNALLDRLAGSGHACKVVAGRSSSCGQKNHSLLAGLKHLRPTADIVVFCDSANEADPNWLSRLVGPIVSGRFRAVTTFRHFDPLPPTLGGLSQAIYATAVTVLKAFFPLPWGGGTAVRRDVLERLDLEEVWATTVIDDLTLSNALRTAGVAVKMEPACQLRSPLMNQTVVGYAGFLTRQILYPKFTNPDIWLSTICLIINTALAAWSAAVLLMPGLLDRTPRSWTIAAGCALLLFVLLAVCLRSVSTCRPSLCRWLLAFGPFLVLSAFVCVRSLFQTRINWQGRYYRVGRGGVVLGSGACGTREG